MTPKSANIQLHKHNQHTPQRTATRGNKTGSCFLRFDLRHDSHWHEGRGNLEQRHVESRDVRRDQVRDGGKAARREEGTRSKGMGVRLTFGLPVCQLPGGAASSLLGTRENACTYVHTLNSHHNPVR